MEIKKLENSLSLVKTQMKNAERVYQRLTGQKALLEKLIEDEKTGDKKDEKKKGKK